MQRTGYRRTASVDGARELSGCNSRALEHRLNSCGMWAWLLGSMWDIPGLGLEPESPALNAEGFFPTEPPGKPPDRVFMISE